MRIVSVHTFNSGYKDVRIPGHKQHFICRAFPTIRNDWKVVKFFVFVCWITSKWQILITNINNNEQKMKTKWLKCLKHHTWAQLALWINDNNYNNWMLQVFLCQMNCIMNFKQWFYSRIILSMFQLKFLLSFARTNCYQS